jgi:tetratricopeptide (TPR) repeat protein
LNAKPKKNQRPLLNLRSLFFWLSAATLSCMMLIAGAVLIFRLLIPQGAPNGLITTPVPQVALSAQDAAAQAAASANLATSAASSIMSFIQTVGTILGLLLIGGIASTFGYVLRVVSKYEQDLDEIKRQSANNIQVQTLLQLGKQQVDFKNDESAREALEHAQRLEPENPAVNYFLGELYLREYQHSNRLEQAIDALERAIVPTETYNRYPSAEAALAYAYRLRGQDYGLDTANGKEYFRKAEKLFKKALDKTPSLRGINGELWLGAQGSLYRQLGDNKRAIECYKRSVSLSPDRSYPLNNIALLYYLEGDIENGNKFFEQSKKIALRLINSDESNTFARFDLFTAQLVLNENDVEATFQRIKEDEPNRETWSKLKTGLDVLKLSKAEIRLLDNYLSRIETDMDKAL